MLENEQGYQMIQTTAVRFLIEFANLDPEYIYPVYNNAKIAEILLRHLELPSVFSGDSETVSRMINDEISANDRMQQMFKVSIFLGFLVNAVKNTEDFSSFFIKCTPALERIL